MVSWAWGWHRVGRAGNNMVVVSSIRMARARDGGAVGLYRSILSGTKHRKLPCETVDL